jgi:hypothetical protein
LCHHFLQVKTITVNKPEVESKTITVTKPATQTFTTGKQVCATIPTWGGSGYGW